MSNFKTTGLNYALQKKRGSYKERKLKVLGWKLLCTRTGTSRVKKSKCSRISWNQNKEILAFGRMRDLTSPRLWTLQRKSLRVEAEWTNSRHAPDPRGPWNGCQVCLQEQAAYVWWLIPQDKASSWPEARKDAAAGHYSTLLSAVTSGLPLPDSRKHDQILKPLWLFVIKPFIPFGQGQKGWAQTTKCSLNALKVNTDCRHDVS